MFESARNLVTQLASILLLLVAISTSSVTATEVGQLSGDFSVDPQGNATYQIPIQVQSGVNGLQPGVGLGYSSRGGNGHLGIGWSLSGMSTITRCSKTAAIDGSANTVQYNSTDKFCLDGQRLVAHSGAYGANGSQYRTDTESFTKVTSLNTIYGGPRQFVVMDKSGIKKYYGERPGNTSARILLTQSGGALVTHQWMISKIEDQYGNHIHFDYWMDAVNGEYRLSKIQYGNGTNSAGQVVFAYDTSRTDKIYGYGFKGTKQQLTNRLARIDVYGKTAALGSHALARRYYLSYEYGTLNKLSYLKSVKECDAEGVNCLAPTTFTWEHGSRSYGSAIDLRDIDGKNFRFLDMFGDGSADNLLVEAQYINGVYVPGNMNVSTVADIDGDGRQDYIYPNSGNTALYMMTSKSGSTVTKQYLRGQYASSYITAVDLTQDGLPEILVRYGGTLRVYKNTPTGLSSTPINTGFQLSSEQRMIPIEFDGDGVPEVFVTTNGCSAPGGGGGGGGGSDPNDPPLQIHSVGTDIISDENLSSDSQSNSAGRGNSNSANNRNNQHSNSDDLLTIAAVGDTSSSNCYNTAGILKWTGNGFEQVSISPKAKHDKIHWADFNGDGLTEYAVSSAAGGVYAYLNTGNGFSSYTWSERTLPSGDFGRAVVMDYNRDGKQDFGIKYHNPRHWKVYQSNGSGGFTKLTVYNTSLPTNGEFGGYSAEMDYNGDGMPDMQYFEDDTWEDSDDRDIYIRINQGKKSGKLVKVENGIGQQTQISYAVMTTSIYKGHETAAKANGTYGSKGFTGNRTNLPTYPVRNFVAPMDLVSAFTISNGLGGSITTEYGYEGAKVGQDGRGFMGFSHVRSHNLNTRTVTDNYYRQDKLYAGMVTKSEQWKPQQAEPIDTGGGLPPVPPDQCQIWDDCGNFNLQSTTPDYQLLGQSSTSTDGEATDYVKKRNQKYKEKSGKGQYKGKGKQKVTDSDGDSITLSVASSFSTGSSSYGIWDAALNASGTRVSLTVNTFGQLNSSQNRPYPYVKQSIERHYKYLSTSVYKRIINNFTYTNYGCAATTKTTTDTGTSGSDTHTTQTTNTYANYTTSWNLCKLTASTVKHTRKNYSSNNDVPVTATRKSTFTYDSVKGHIKTETVEPGNATQAVTKTYTYDGRGNRTKETVSGSGFASRSTSTAYDSIGLFPISTTNALGHSETYAWDYTFGVRTAQTGPNSLTTTTTIDNFGRTIKVTSPRTAKYVSSVFNWCSGKGLSPSIACADTRSVYRVAEKDSAAGNRIVKTTEYDMLGRSVHTTALTLKGQYAHTQVHYDAIGREKFSSNAYFPGGKVCWNEVRYDNLNRKVQERGAKDDSVCTTSVTPVGYSDANSRINRFEYDGLLARSYDPNGRKVERVTNVLGRLLTVSEWDDANQLVRTTYDYDAQGNTTWVQDANGNITKMRYDLRGNKTQMIDPDMGTWTYTYNALGELISQKDAKNQTVSMTYDLLGRMKTRTEPEGTSTWWYDNSDLGASVNYHGAKAIGKVTRVVSPGGYDKRYKYDDNYGAPYLEFEKIDGVWRRTDFRFDGYGRQTYIIYPSTHATAYSSYQYRLYTYKDYNIYGFQYRTRAYDRLNGQWDYVWQAKNVDPNGNILEESLRNGVTEYKSFDLATGFQNDAMAVKDAAVHLDQSYEWDLAGNLLSRVDHKNTEREDFTYDILYRLKTTKYRKSASAGAAVSRTDSHTYDKIGNLIHKGNQYRNYNYAGSTGGPHAVNSVWTTAGTRNYSYDNNGNLRSVTGGNGNSTVVWKSFNKPLSITKDSSNNSLFVYGADRQRIVQVAKEKGVTTRTVYVSNIYEKRTTGTTVEHHHYIYAGGRAIAIAKAFGNLTTNISPVYEYLHRNHQGSIEAISNDAGNVIQLMSFDAWGKRRSPINWNQTSPGVVPVFSSAPYKVASTKRGYTGHEMLDNVGLVHMNGRVYDPEIGRFLSADVYIQFPESTQGFNRYTYVGNNPMSYNDPSGHFITLIAAVVVKAAGWSTVTAFWVSVGASAVQGYLQTGSLAGALQSGLMTAVSAGVAFGVGSAFGDAAQFSTKAFAKALVHGATQGGVSKAFGGDFKSSFIGGTISSAMEGKIEDLRYEDPARAIAVAAISGGAGSAIAGGSFKDGAKSAGFVELFNAQVAIHQYDTAVKYMKNKAGLTDEELKYLQANKKAAVGIYRAQKKALTVTGSLYTSGFHKGDADAFRHAYWNALMVRYAGKEHAVAFGNLHESSNPNLLNPNDTVMDYFNNGVGVNISSKKVIHPYRIEFIYKYETSALSRVIYDAVSNGQMLTLDSNHQLQRSGGGSP